MAYIKVLCIHAIHMPRLELCKSYAAKKLNMFNIYGASSWLYRAESISLAIVYICVYIYGHAYMGRVVYICRFYVVCIYGTIYMRLCIHIPAIPRSDHERSSGLLLIMHKQYRNL
jgi:hypothetical protein